MQPPRSSQPLPSVGKPTVPFCCIFKSKEATLQTASGPARRPAASASSGACPPPSPQPPAPSAAADFAPTPARPVPTLTEEEEAEEEQIQLERSHSSARGQPAGQLGRAVSSLQARRLGSRCSASAAGPPGFAPTIYLSVRPSVPSPVLFGLVVSPGICRQSKPNACSQPPREAKILSNVPTRSRSILWLLASQAHGFLWRAPPTESEGASE